METVKNIFSSERKKIAFTERSYCTSFLHVSFFRPLSIKKLSYGFYVTIWNLFAFSEFSKNLKEAV